MIAFLILASSELQPWARKQIPQENIDENLLSNMWLEKNPKSIVQLSIEA